jgi:hypothetical protein
LGDGEPLLWCISVYLIRFFPISSHPTMGYHHSHAPGTASQDSGNETLGFHDGDPRGDLGDWSGLSASTKPENHCSLVSDQIDLSSNEELVCSLTFEEGPVRDGFVGISPG